MKSETLKEIQNLCQLINKLSDDEGELKKSLNDSVMRIINYETEAPKVGKFDAFKFLGKLKKDDHPMCGVIHHQSGYADIFTRIYGVRCKSLYNEKYEGKCVNQAGEDVKMTYPKVESVLPSKLKEYPISIDFDALYESVKYYNNFRKLNKNFDKLNCLTIVGGIAVFNIYILQKFVEAAQLINCNEFYITMCNNATNKDVQDVGMIYCINADGEFACAMSIGISSDECLFTVC